MVWYKYPESKPILDRERYLCLFPNGRMEILMWITRPYSSCWVDDDYNNYNGVAYWTIIEAIPIPEDILR